MHAHRVTEEGLKIQAALRVMLRARPLTHWVTLNFHQEFPADQACNRLRMWSWKVADRLFRAHVYAMEPMADLFRFCALPELTHHGHYHFHLVAFVHHTRADWFGRCAGRFWLKVVPRGTAHIAAIGTSPEDAERVISYASKDSHRPIFYEQTVFSEMILPARHHDLHRTRSARYGHCATPVLEHGRRSGSRLSLMPDPTDAAHCKRAD